MSDSVYLDCSDIKALRYKIFSTNFSELSQAEVKSVRQINSYLTEEMSLCTDVRRITLSQKELNVVSTILEGDLEIESISDLKKVKQGS